MRKYKIGCFICGKETRASRYGITERSIDVCYECHKNKPTSLNKNLQVTPSASPKEATLPSVNSDISRNFVFGWRK